MKVSLPFERVWSLSKVPEIYIITGNLLGGPGEVKRSDYPRKDFAAIMASGDVRSFGEVLGTLKTRCKKIPIKHYFAEAFPKENYRKNIVSIGGPIFNEVTRNLLPEVDWKVRFENSTLVDEEFPAAGILRLEETMEGSEYGFALKAINPEGAAESKVIIIAGCATFGVLAATRWVSVLEDECNLCTLASKLVEPRFPWLSRIRGLLPAEERFFLIIVRADRRGNDVTNPEVLRLYVGTRAKKKSRKIKRLGCFKMDEHGELKRLHGYP
jgi:hypothetical protein